MFPNNARLAGDENPPASIIRLKTGSRVSVNHVNRIGELILAFHWRAVSKAGKSETMELVDK